MMIIITDRVGPARAGRQYLELASLGRYAPLARLRRPLTTLCVSGVLRRYRRMSPTWLADLANAERGYQKR